MKKLVLYIFVISIGNISFASYAPITIALPDLLGTYYIDGGGKTASFDLGEPVPFEIGNVSLILNGSFEPGVALWDGTDDSRIVLWASLVSVIQVGQSALDGIWVAGFSFSEDNLEFSSEALYTPYWGATWDFLSDGEATIPLALGATLQGSTIVEVPPIADIAEAFLVINPIPEPGTVLLLGLGGMFLRRRKRISNIE